MRKKHRCRVAVSLFPGRYKVGEGVGERGRGSFGDVARVRVREANGGGAAGAPCNGTADAEQQVIGT